MSLLIARKIRCKQQIQVLLEMMGWRLFFWRSGKDGSCEMEWIQIPGKRGSFRRGAVRGRWGNGGATELEICYYSENVFIFIAIPENLLVLYMKVCNVNITAAE